jgi:hypothetical protein
MYWTQWFTEPAAGFAIDEDEQMYQWQFPEGDEVEFQQITDSQALRWVVMTEDEVLFAYVFHLTPDINHEDVAGQAVTLFDWLHDGIAEYDLDAGDGEDVPEGFWGEVAPIVLIDPWQQECSICHDDFEPEEEGDEQLCCGVCGHVFCGLCIRNMHVDRRAPCPMCRAPLGELRRWDRV